MQQRHKQRLVGAVVVVALAVIFLPMLLRGPVEHRTLDVPVDVPPRPAAESGSRPAPQPGDTPPPALERIPLPDVAPEDTPSDPGEGELADAVAPDPPPAEAAGEAEGTTPEAGETAPTEAPSDRPGFAVQVGSFRSRDNALALRDDLRERGFSAYVDESDAGEGATVYRLRVGPVGDREEARGLAARIEDEAGVEGIVVASP